MIKPIPDMRKLYRSIERCNAVYEPDDTVARDWFASHGCRVLDRYSSNTAQAVLHYDPDGILTLTIAGTRASEGPLRARAWDIWEDAEEVFSNQDLGDSLIVASGAWQRGTEIWAWASPLIGNKPVNVEGHSLGGQTTHALLAIIPSDVYANGIAWEPPKAGNAKFWQSVDVSRVLTVFNGMDPWAGHPWVSMSLYHPTGDILWLDNDVAEWVTRDTWVGPSALHAGDHDTDAVMRVVAKIGGFNG